MQVVNCDCFVYHGLHTKKEEACVISICDHYIFICDNNNDTISSNVGWDAHFDTIVDWSNLFKYI